MMPPPLSRCQLPRPSTPSTAASPSPPLAAPAPPALHPDLWIAEGTTAARAAGKPGDTMPTGYQSRRELEPERMSMAGPSCQGP